jgi:hypothetical protein
MTDTQAKRGLWISLLLGAVLGLALGSPRYGALGVRTWNLMGLTVIGVVFLYSILVVAIAARRYRKKAQE